jgi:hypothetical protein
MGMGDGVAVYLVVVVVVPVREYETALREELYAFCEDVVAVR